MAKTSLYTSLSPELMERLEQRAEASGLSKSALVALAVERMLNGSRPGGADTTEYPATGPVVAAEPIRAAAPAPTPAGAVAVGVANPKQHCIHPVSRRSGSVCMACGAQNLR